MTTITEADDVVLKLPRKLADKLADVINSHSDEGGDSCMSEGWSSQELRELRRVVDEQMSRQLPGTHL